MTTNGLEPSSTGRGKSVAGVDLYWLPLGAGGHFVCLNGRVFEAVVSRLEHRPACDLYHSALQVRVPEGRLLIDRLMPCYDAVRAEHAIVPGDIATVYAATRRADFIRAWRESATVRLLFAARGLGERASH